MNLAHYICVTCGVQFSRTESPPSSCPICEDARQYVGHGGQQWTTLEQLQREHTNVIQELEPHLYSIHTQPKFGIGQRAFFIQTNSGNILWDCVSLLDSRTVEFIENHGGIDAIAISHPHYYSCMIEWSQSFKNAPIFLHEHETPWVMDMHENICFWSGEHYELKDGLTLYKTGGHFDGYQVLHWRDGAEGKGILFAGDQPQVCMDLDWVSFMYSYPNFIPLSEKKIRHIMDVLSPLPYERLYGAFLHQNMTEGAKEKVEKSADRYIYYLQQ